MILPRTGYPPTWKNIMISSPGAILRQKNSHRSIRSPCASVQAGFVVIDDFSQPRSGMVCHPEPIRFAQGKLREGSGSMGKEILRFAQDDRIDRMTVPTVVVKARFNLDE